jgi:hypothetical protein
MDLLASFSNDSLTLDGSFLLKKGVKIRALLEKGM